MMMKKMEKQDCAYTIKITTIDEDGSFQCPKCKMSISPEDENEENYTIEGTKLVNGELSELKISCGKCGSIIKLVGFQVL
jgi:hypothetical protein